MLSLAKALLLLSVVVVAAGNSTPSLSTETGNTDNPVNLRGRRATARKTVARAAKKAKKPKPPKDEKAGGKAEKAGGKEEKERSGEGVQEQSRFFGENCAIDQSDPVQAGFYNCKQPSELEMYDLVIDNFAAFVENGDYSAKNVEKPFQTAEGGWSCERDDYCSHAANYPHPPYCLPITQTWSGVCLCPFDEANKPDCPGEVPIDFPITTNTTASP